MSFITVVPTIIATGTIVWNVPPGYTEQGTAGLMFIATLIASVFIGYFINSVLSSNPNTKGQ